MGAVGGLSANRLSWRKRAGQENPQNLAALSRSVYCMALKATGDRFFLSFFSLFFGATALYTYLLYGCAACARACLFVSLFVCQSVSLFGWLFVRLCVCVCAVNVGVQFSIINFSGRRSSLTIKNEKTGKEPRTGKKTVRFAEMGKVFTRSDSMSCA